MSGVVFYFFSFAEFQLIVLLQQTQTWVFLIVLFPDFDFLIFIGCGWVELHLFLMHECKITPRFHLLEHKIADFSLREPWLFLACTPGPENVFRPNYIFQFWCIVRGSSSAIFRRQCICYYHFFETASPSFGTAPHHTAYPGTYWWFTEITWKYKTIQNTRLQEITYLFNWNTRTAL